MRKEARDKTRVRESEGMMLYKCCMLPYSCFIHRERTIGGRSQGVPLLTTVFILVIAMSNTKGYGKVRVV